EWLELCLADPACRPIAWGHAWNHGGWKQEYVPDLAFDAHGRARLLRPLRPLALEASAPGFRRTSFGPFEPAALGAELVLTLQPGECVRGRVTCAGRPVAGAAL